MSEHSRGSQPSDESGPGAVTADSAGPEPMGRRTTDKDAADSALLRFEQEQLAREYAEIERASAALRLAQPALESWSKPASPPAVSKSRPLWLLIGALWLSTALVTAGAVVAIGSFAG